MSECSTTQSEASKNWPEGIISVKMTMNPYLLAMAEERAHSQGIRLWEYLNMALWETLGRPDDKELMAFAAQLDLGDEDPKWKKRLKITAMHEVEIAAARKSSGANLGVKREALAGDNNGGGSAAGDPRSIDR